jgi:hypothetical protein
MRMTRSGSGQVMDYPLERRLKREAGCVPVASLGAAREFDLMKS